MIKTNIYDPNSGIKAKVTEDESLVITTQTFPPKELQKVQPFRQMMTIDGTPDGTASMKVLGSAANPISFWVPANENARYIMQITFVIGGASPTLYQIGTATALKSGCVLFYTDSYGREVIIHPDLRTNFDFVRMCGIASNGVLLDKALSNTVSAFMPTLYLDQIVPPFGIKLEPRSKQRIVMNITDDTTVAGLSELTAQVYGFERLP
jgi:hypothetical protein